MILLIDIGNSRVKWAEVHEDKLMPSSQLCYTYGEFPVGCFNDISLTPQEIYLASVGGDVIADQVTLLCQKRWRQTPTYLQSESYSSGVSNGYHTATDLGIDRWAAIVGAYEVVGGAVLLIDCGTACTADLVDSDGRHLGGAIMPGLHMMQNSLRLDTALLASQYTEPKGCEFGKTTGECVGLGLAEAMLGFLERMEGMALSQVGEGVTILITGGGAEGLLPHLPSNIRYEKELVFMGMASMVAEK